MKNSYIEKIKYLRVERGISQKEMADRLGFGQSNYNKIENGITELSVSKLMEIADILEVSVSVILGNSEVDNLKNEMAKKDNFILFLIKLSTELANGANTEENPKGLQELIERLKKKSPYPIDEETDDA